MFAFDLVHLPSRASQITARNNRNVTTVFYFGTDRQIRPYTLLNTAKKSIETPEIKAEENLR
jgi:enoyl-[acyl-carrier-protein] reductase (NADH)